MLLRNYIQNYCGISRRRFTSLVDDGVIFLNDTKISSYSQEIKNGDMLKIDGVLPMTKVSLNNVYERKILILNKPEGIIVSRSNNQGKNIYDILPDKYKNWYYIGRLDKNSCGLLLLVNDSALVNEYSHPSKKIEKEYEVITNRKLTTDETNKSLKGIINLEEKLSFKKIEFVGLIGGNPGNFLYRIYLEEGKNRHIRRVFDSFGMKVISLKRVREGNIVLGNIKSGNYKEINLL